jgi:alpha-galactosidase
VTKNIIVRAADIDFTCMVETVDNVEIDVQATAAQVNDDTYLIHFVACTPTQAAFQIRNLQIDWTIPISDMHGLYFGGYPRQELSYLPFWKTTKNICANTGVPYIALINRNAENRAAFGLFDQITETAMHAELSEITRCYHFSLQKPANKESNGQTIPVTEQWQETLFVSKSRQEWSQVLQHYVQLVDEGTQLDKMPVPEHAFDPVFCTWTAMHHDISHDWILRNARLAADLGFKTWITDDGWFIETGQFSNYHLAGDWLPSDKKFPDFREHVQAVQDLGFRYILWVAPFMVGNDSQAAQKYPHLLTNGQERNNFKNLSLWHEETHQVVFELLERLVSDYNLDGLKIDFLDSISVNSVRTAGANDTTLGDNFYHLLHGVTQKLLTLHPELLIEYRNSYANLASRSYANIYRSSDVPINFALNRWQAVMLRLLTPDRAVHLDPALWHPDEDETNVAVHLINLLVSVPMVSIELDRYPDTHLNLIRRWIGFYNSHQDTLIHGVFKPMLRWGYIPLVKFESAIETIIALYDDIPVTLDTVENTVWILNASTQSVINILSSAQDGGYTLHTYNKFGTLTNEETVRFPLTQLTAEVGGSVKIEKCS